jgi:hypothetical protein
MSALGWLRASWSRLVAGLAFATVATVTGVISYMHIEALTLALHQPLVVARLMPFGIDGLIVVGSVALLQAAPDQEHLGWLCVAPGAAASLFANVESGLRHGPLAAGWAGMASAGFFLATFTLERWAKAQAATPAGVAAPNMLANDGEDDGDKPSPCPHSLAMTAEEGLVQAFLHVRDCLWQEPSQRKLSTAFGISRPRVAELVAPYVTDAPDPAPEPSMNGVGASAQ